MTGSRLRAAGTHVSHVRKTIRVKHTSSSQTDSHADTQVPDLQQFLLNSCKYCGTSRGPLDVHYGSLSGDEAQHWLRLISSPQLDGPIRGATQECLSTKRRPRKAIYRTLWRQKTGQANGGHTTPTAASLATSCRNSNTYRVLPVYLQKVLSVGTGALVDETFKCANQVDTGILSDRNVGQR